jgi:hypothetical protein
VLRDNSRLTLLLLSLIFPLVLERLHMRVTRTLIAAAGAAVALVGLAATSAQADSNGPNISYFKAPLPIIGTSLTNSSSTPGISVKDGWTLFDTDGVCSAYTELYQSGSGWSTIWSFGGSKSTTTVSSNHAWSTPIGSYNELYAHGTDCLGNTSSQYDYVDPSLQQEGAATYGRGWTSSACSCWSGGAVLHSSKAGATANYTFSGRLVSLVSNYGPNGTRGTVSLSIDGRAAHQVSLDKAAQQRVIAYNSGYLSDSQHTLTVKVVSGRVDVDGFVVQD